MAIGDDILQELELGQCDLAEMYGIVSQAAECVNLQMSTGTSTEAFINAMGLLQIALRDRVFKSSKRPPVRS
jgi:hypothetical protein